MDPNTITKPAIINNTCPSSGGKRPVFGSVDPSFLIGGRDEDESVCKNVSRFSFLVGRIQEPSRSLPQR
jgi:hypothetical protein